MLSFFKFAIRFLSAVFVFAVAIILPIHYKYTGHSGIPGWDDDGDKDGKPDKKLVADPRYLWMYVIFAYIFTSLAIYLLLQETDKIIHTRQKYLASQTSTTDRTIRLSGIPKDMGSEGKIKDFIEGLEIGKVETVTLCRNWSELDLLIDERVEVIRQLERAWTKHLGYKRKKTDSNSLPLTRQTGRRASLMLGDDNERSQLLSEGERDPDHVSGHSQNRPTVRLWYGPLRLRYQTVDAIDYYEERLRKLDEKIDNARLKEYPPTELAFVTMESLAACQMVVQAILDPHPMRLLARLAPAPADVIWRNTYVSRSRRMMQSWFITAVIGFLTIFWSVLLFPVASLLELETLHKVFPGLADALAQHLILKSLVQTGLPTLALSLLTVAVPYLYSCKFPTR